MVQPAAVTPAAVSATDVAATVPFFAVVPCTITVSPGCIADAVLLASRVYVVDFPSITLTRPPLAVVT